MFSLIGHTKSSRSDHRGVYLDSFWNPQTIQKWCRKKENTSNNEGVTDGEGDQGREYGDPNAKAYSGGGIGTNGIAFSLGGRIVSELKKPIYKSQVQGTVVVTIRVNRQGKVINATPGAKGSNTTNSYLYARAKEAALQTIFDPNPSAPEIQIGTIVYNFRLQ